MPSKATQTFDPPVELEDALRMFLRALSQGRFGEGSWYAPKDGMLQAQWLNRKGCYRFTIDLMPPGTERDDQM